MSLIKFPLLINARVLSMVSAIALLTACGSDSKPAPSVQAESEQAESVQAESEQAESEQPESEQAESEQAESEQPESEQPESEQPESEQPAPIVTQIEKENTRVSFDATAPENTSGVVRYYLKNGNNEQVAEFNGYTINEETGKVLSNYAFDFEAADAKEDGLEAAEGTITDYNGTVYTNPMSLTVITTIDNAYAAEQTHSITITDVNTDFQMQITPVENESYSFYYYVPTDNACSDVAVAWENLGAATARETDFIGPGVPAALRECQISNTFTSADSKTITISGDAFTGLSFSTENMDNRDNRNNSAHVPTEILNWGDARFERLKLSTSILPFNIAINNDAGAPNLKAFTGTPYMFYRTTFNSDISLWDVSNVTNMTSMFYNAVAFNQPIGDWNTASVTNMGGMFCYAAVFNQPIGDWNTASVTNMDVMFRGTRAFNQSINTTGDKWNTASVTNMGRMFYNAIAFNSDISLWDVSNVTNMDRMFSRATAFDQDISKWAVTDRAYRPGFGDSSGIANKPHFWPEAFQ